MTVHISKRCRIHTHPLTIWAAMGLPSRAAPGGRTTRKLSVFSLPLAGRSHSRAHPYTLHVKNIPLWRFCKISGWLFRPLCFVEVWCCFISLIVIVIMSKVVFNDTAVLAAWENSANVQYLRVGGIRNVIIESRFIPLDSWAIEAISSKLDVRIDLFPQRNLEVHDRHSDAQFTVCTVLWFSA